MRLTRHNRNRRLNIPPRRRPPQQRQQHNHHQRIRHHIRRNLHLIPLRHARRIQTQQRRIRQHHIQPLQLPLGTATKRAHTLKRTQIQRPDLDHGVAGLLLGQLDVRPGGLAALGAAAGQDDAGGAQADKVAGGFEAEAAVCAGDDDGAAGVGGAGEGEGAELGLEEVSGYGEAGRGG